MFYLSDVLTVEAEEIVRGHLTCRPNDKNRRDLDIGIDYTLQTEDEKRRAEGHCEYRMC